MSGSTTPDTSIGADQDIAAGAGALQRLGTPDELSSDREQVAGLSALTRQAFGCVDDPLWLSGPLADARSNPQSIIAYALLRAGGIGIDAYSAAKAAFLNDVADRLDHIEDLPHDEIQALEDLFLGACKVIEDSIPNTPWEIVETSID